MKNTDTIKSVCHVYLKFNELKYNNITITNHLNYRFAKIYMYVPNIYQKEVLK